MSKSKIIAFLFTTFVIMLLVFSGPVEGFTLRLDSNKEKSNEIITYTAQINIEQLERVQIGQLVLKLSGRENIACTFDKSGQPLDGCGHIKVTKIQDPGYSYGYYNFGYGYGMLPGTLSYKIEVDTKGLKSGDYTSVLEVAINNQTYTQPGKTFRIKKSSSQICAPEWTCSTWSECSGNVQRRECYRNVDYCLPTEKPLEERLCLLDDGQAFPEEKATLNSIDASTISSESRDSLVPGEFSEKLRFIIILLLMNCIITTTNIIVKLQQNFVRLTRRKMRRLPKMPSVKKTR